MFCKACGNPCATNSVFRIKREYFEEALCWKCFKWARKILCGDK